jgi:urease accessory protein
MIRATAIVRCPAVDPARTTGTITLDYAGRHRRRIALESDDGLAFLLDLDRATMLDDGDAIRLDDGRLIVVRAAPEDLVEARTESSLRLLQLAWHLGNRHVPVEITADAVYFAADHVLAQMVRGLGARTSAVRRPFRPERGAYDHGHD